MNVNYEQFRSEKSGNKPWYVVDVDDTNGDVVVKEDKDGGRDGGLSTARSAIPGHVDFPDQAAVSESGWVRYAVTELGDLVSYDPMDISADVPPLRAHLGTYNPETDTLTLLEFVEQS